MCLHAHRDFFKLSPKERAWDLASRLLPATRWLRTYDVKKQLLKDVAAGVAVACLIVPQALSYAQVAGFSGGLLGNYSSLQSGLYTDLARTRGADAPDNARVRAPARSRPHPQTPTRRRRAGAGLPVRAVRHCAVPAGRRGVRAVTRDAGHRRQHARQLHRLDHLHRHGPGRARRVRRLAGTVPGPHGARARAHPAHPPHAEREPRRRPSHPLQLNSAAALAFFTGIFQFVIGLFGVGYIMNVRRQHFTPPLCRAPAAPQPREPIQPRSRAASAAQLMSRPVISGFQSGAAITIGVSQLKNVFGYLNFTNAQNLITMGKSFYYFRDEVNLRTTAWGWAFTGFLFIFSYVGRIKPKTPGSKGRALRFFRFFKITGPVLARARAAARSPSAAA